MDPAQLQQFLESFQAMAKTNQELATAVQARAQTNQGAAAMNNAPHTDTSGSVALTNMKIPLEMGESAEERLVNFHEWKEEVMDKLMVAGVDDERRQTTIALMWGGKDIKGYAIEKAGVQLYAVDDTPADGWTTAVEKIETKMEEGINQAFAMFKFCQNEEGK